MSRTRLIKPGFFTNDVLAEVPAIGRVLFAGLWTIADREGRLEDRPKRIKAELLPFDSANVDKLLDALAERGFITRYESGGQRIIQIVSFARHQSPHPKEPTSKLPAMDESVACQCLDTDNTVSSPASYLDPILPSPLPLDPAPDAQQGAAPASGRTPRARKPPLVPLTDTERTELLEKWCPKLPDVNDRIDLALEHEQHWKYPTGQKRYCDNWLRNDWERTQANGRTMGTRANTNGRGSSPQDDPELHRLQKLGIIVE
ncbi:MAG: hypothetical protein NUW01_10335 [Gemmatimonadaceae bacterium]|nr:hypothetical protein [Gemmatimonadaceae bacterium]